MKKTFSQLKHMAQNGKAKVLAVGSAVVVGTTNAMAAIPTVDLAEADTAITQAGGAMITLSITILGLALVIGFISRRR